MKYFILLCMVISCSILCADTTTNELPQVKAIKSAVLSNDTITIRKEFDTIDWVNVKNPEEVLQIISKELKDNDKVKELRKEIKTKYNLIKDVSDTNLTDTIDDTQIPIVHIHVVQFPTVKFPIQYIAAIDQLNLAVVDLAKLEFPNLIFSTSDYGTIVINGLTVNVYSYNQLNFHSILINGLTYTYTDIVQLNPDVLKLLGIMVPVVPIKETEIVMLQIDNKQFLALIELWEKRYGAVIDYYDSQGRRIIPGTYSVLWYQRKALMAAIENGTITEKMWTDYNHNFEVAVARRIQFSRRAKPVSRIRK